MSSKFPTILIIGHGRHGKDTVAEYFADTFDMTYKSSSQAAAEIFIYDELKDSYGYKNFNECYEDRVNRRSEWYQMITKYNSGDRAKLAKGILVNNQCYVGMRDRDEITECIRQGIFDIIIWVDASKRYPQESSDSFNIDVSCADFIIDNNGTLDELEEKLFRIGGILFQNR
jgi:dephospho-CoA kinase